MRHEFLLALEESGCVSGQTGWQPKHLLVTENNELIAGMTLYLKTHSRGEYVFDHQWVYAYEQNRVSYYPKWLDAIPFTPCQGLRIAIKEQADQQQITELLVDFIKTQSEQETSPHGIVYFPSVNNWNRLGRWVWRFVKVCNSSGLIKDYQTFDDFLNTLSASKRKMLKRERRKVSEQGIEMIQLVRQGS